MSTDTTNLLDIDLSELAISKEINEAAKIFESITLQVQFEIPYFTGAGNSGITGHKL